ncbi:MAG: hypothetical protein HY912_06520 [Desulfomonile tiedjei]|uniref:Uncharacterized protein n=1 Tax=Desulfomonile tiedjei TaxID=2358 RepID=A0A9D6V1W9_9BACT|nr:hypothetical protein [Desulfomonile tiedjei]
MVKRTLVVLGILSMLLTAGSASAYLGYGFPGAGSDCGPCPPLFLPVDCPPYPVAKTIVKTWQCKIVGPCPAPGPMAACGTDKTSMSPGMITSIANLLGMPFDLLFNHADSVYGCFNGFGGGGGPCGPCFGPVPSVIAAVPMALGAPTVMFGALW